MRKTLAIVARDLQEWKRVFVAALAAGTLVFLTPLLPATRSYSMLETMNVTAAAMAVLFGLGVAVLAGGGFIGRDLAERRMSFYFYRPLRSGSIWAGKLLSANLLAVFSALLTLVPATLAGGGLFLLGDELGQRNLALLATAILVVVVLANSLNLSFRARSGWVLLDFVAVVSIAGLLGVAAYPLMRERAEEMLRLLAITFGVAVLIGFAVAGFVGLRRGRIDIRDVHKAHALTIWPTLALVAVLLILYTFWAVAAQPRDLDWAYLRTAAASGPWVAVGGSSRNRPGYYPAFLINAENGQHQKLEGDRGLEFSRDGTRAVWCRPLGFDRDHCQIVVADLVGKTSVRETEIVLGQWDRISAFEGNRLAVRTGTPDDVMTVFDLESEKNLASVRLPSGVDWLEFRNPEELRILTHSSGKPIGIYMFDIGKRSLTQTGSVELPLPHLGRVTSLVDGRILGRSNDGKDLSFHHPQTGKRVGGVKLPGGEMQRVLVLADGRVVVAYPNGGRARIELFSPEGAALTSLDAGPATHLRLGGEAAAGKFFIANSTADRGKRADFVEDSQLFLVDIDRQIARKVGEKLAPLGLWHYRVQPPDGSVASKMFRTKGNSLVSIDPISGKRRTIAGRG